MVHCPRRSGLEGPANCKHSATPPETPPRHAGNKFVLNRKPSLSANEAAKMKDLAS